MTTRRTLSTFILSFMLLNIILGCYFVSVYQDKNTFNATNIDKTSTKLTIPESPKLSDQPNSLNQSNIYQNTTQVFRVYQSIYFELNISGFVDKGGNRSIMQISFTNGTTVDYNMTRVGITSNYTYLYTPEYYAPYGLQTVKFRVYNGTILLNNMTFSAYTSFTILKNCIAELNSSQYSRGDFLHADLVLVHSEPFNLNITIVDSSFQVLFEIEAIQFTTQLFALNLEINESFSLPNQDYYIQINLTRQSDGIWDLPQFKFKVLNSIPRIVESTVSFSPSEVYRTKDCTVNVNVTDVENSPADISVKLILEDPVGDQETYTLSSIGGLNKYRTVFSIDGNKPAGKYSVNLTATDKQGGMDTYYDILTVKNNPPKIDYYEVNNFTQDESVSINYGEDLIFTFNVSDIEGEVKYIKVALLNEEDEWYNMTSEYYGEDMELRVRTVELITGVWYVYIYVTDQDGETIGLDFDYDSAPQEIIIIPDTLSAYLPWIVFFIGMGIGGTIGILIGYFRIKTKISKTTEGAPKTKPIKPKAITKKPTSKPQKALKSSLAKETPESEKEELKPMDLKKEETTKETKDKPQRKIKRKL